MPNALSSICSRSGDGGNGQEWASPSALSSEQPPLETLGFKFMRSNGPSCSFPYRSASIAPYPTSSTRLLRLVVPFVRHQRTLNLGTIKVCIGEVGAAEVGSAKVRSEEVGAVKVSTAEVGVAEVGSGQIGAA